MLTNFIKVEYSGGEAALRLNQDILLTPFEAFKIVLGTPGDQEYDEMRLLFDANMRSEIQKDVLTALIQLTAVGVLANNYVNRTDVYRAVRSRLVIPFDVQQELGMRCSGVSNTNLVVALFRHYRMTMNNSLYALVEDTLKLSLTVPLLEGSTIEQVVETMELVYQRISCDQEFARKLVKAKEKCRDWF